MHFVRGGTEAGGGGGGVGERGAGGGEVPGLWAMMFDDDHWYAVKDGDPRATALYERHYSCVNLKARRRTGDRRICGPGEKMVLLTAGCDALFVWRKAKRPDLAGQEGAYCSIFRNEGDVLSSELILEAEQLAWRKWPDARLYTYVDPGKVGSPNPGYCFKVAGWQKCGETQGGLHILEKRRERGGIGSRSGGEVPGL